MFSHNALSLELGDRVLLSFGASNTFRSDINSPFPLPCEVCATLFPEPSISKSEKSVLRSAARQSGTCTVRKSDALYSVRALSWMIKRQQTKTHNSDVVTKHCELARLNLTAAHFFHQLRQWIELSVHLICVTKIQSSVVVEFSSSPLNFFSCCAAYSSTGAHHEHYLETRLAQIFQEHGRRHDGNALASDVTNVVLPFLHMVHVFLQACLLSPDLKLLNFNISVFLGRSSWFPSFRHLPKFSKNFLQSSFLSQGFP